MDYSIFKERIRELMDNRGLSMKALAEELNISPSTVSRYLTSERTPDLPYLVKLSDYFGVSIDWLLGFEGDKYAPLPKEMAELIHLYSVATPDDRRVIQAVLSKYRTKE